LGGKGGVDKKAWNYYFDRSEWKDRGYLPLGAGPISWRGYARSIIHPQYPIKVSQPAEGGYKGSVVGARDPGTLLEWFSPFYSPSYLIPSMAASCELPGGGSNLRERLVEVKPPRDKRIETGGEAIPARALGEEEKMSIKQKFLFPTLLVPSDYS